MATGKQMSGEVKTKVCECGTEIFFGPSGGRKIPFETKPVIVYIPGNQFGKTVYSPVSGHVNHFFNCPLRNKFRKSNKGGKYGAQAKTDDHEGYR